MILANKKHQEVLSQMENGVTEEHKESFTKAAQKARELGKKANFIITKPVSSLNYLPYSFAENWVERVVIG